MVKSPVLQKLPPGSKGPKGPYSSLGGRDRPPLRFFICVFHSPLPPIAELTPFVEGKGALEDIGEIKLGEGGSPPGGIVSSNGA